AFGEEYARNLARGGAFVRTDESFELREVVQVLLEAGFARAKLALEAEVVHCGGGGVAVHFLDPAPELRARLEPLLARAQAAAIGGDLDFDDDAFEPDFDAAEAAGAVAEGEDPNDRTFRARADRSHARVAVRVRGPNGKAHLGRTRDLSASGLLVSMDG